MYLLVKQTSHPYAKARPYPQQQASLPRGYGRTGAGWSQPWNLLAFAYAAARSRDGHPYTKARPYPLRQASLPPRVRSDRGRLEPAVESSCLRIRCGKKSGWPSLCQGPSIPAAASKLAPRLRSDRGRLEPAVESSCLRIRCGKKPGWPSLCQGPSIPAAASKLASTVMVEPWRTAGCYENYSTIT